MAKELGVSNAIEFTGWKSGFKQVQAELLRGHFFVFPSSGEGLPRSVIEAMASGLLCFGSKIDGVVELLNEKMNAEATETENLSATQNQRLFHSLDRSKIHSSVLAGDEIAIDGARIIVHSQNVRMSRKYLSMEFFMKHIGLPETLIFTIK